MWCIYHCDTNFPMYPRWPTVYINLLIDKFASILIASWALLLILILLHLCWHYTYYMSQPVDSSDMYVLRYVRTYIFTYIHNMHNMHYITCVCMIMHAYNQLCPIHFLYKSIPLKKLITEVLFSQPHPSDNFFNLGMSNDSGQIMSIAAMLLQTHSSIINLLI